MISDFIRCALVSIFVLGEYFRRKFKYIYYRFNEGIHCNFNASKPYTSNHLRTCLESCIQHFNNIFNGRFSYYFYFFFNQHKLCNRLS